MATSEYVSHPEGAAEVGTGEGAVTSDCAPPAYEILSSDVVTHDRQLVASAGERLDRELLERVAAAGKPSERARVPLSRTGVLEDLKGFLSRPTYHHLFGKVRRQFELFSLIRETAMPQLLAGEFSLLRRMVPWAYEQSIVSASVTVLLLRHQLPDEGFLRGAWLAGATRDMGISRIRPKILQHERTLTPVQFAEYLQHQAVSALLCARALGPGLAVHLAARHHRASSGDNWFPSPEGADPLATEKLKQALSVADAFTGMLSPRSFRSTTFSTRGAVDTLLRGAGEGRHDAEIVRLLVAYCRGEFSLTEMRLSQRRDGFVPKVNYYGVSI